MSYKNYKLEDLGCWQNARQFRNKIFKAAKLFPTLGKSLQYQIVRAASSISHNIAEGFGRGSFKENMQFCRIARGSLYEVRDQLYTALDYGYINEEKFNILYSQNTDLERNINGYIGFLKKQLLKYPRA